MNKLRLGKKRLLVMTLAFSTDIMYLTFPL